MIIAPEDREDYRILVASYGAVGAALAWQEVLYWREHGRLPPDALFFDRIERVNGVIIYTHTGRGDSAS